MLKQLRKIIISRTDSIGDVVLTLPLCGFIKEQNPEMKIYFLASAYTIPIVQCCKHVDEIINYDELKKENGVQKIKQYAVDAIVHVFPNKQVALWAKRAGIPLRIGTSHRWFHLFTCNKLVDFTRKKSDLHEAQLNFKLLKPLVSASVPSFEQLIKYYGFSANSNSTEFVSALLHKTQKIVIVHPKSKGSAREWSIDNYSKLIDLLPKDEIIIVVSGTANDVTALKPLTDNPDVINAVGKLNLSEYIYLISKSHVLVACSTGPLHIAAALGIGALGIYPPMRPIHPGRWAPIGRKADFLVAQKQCDLCRKSTICSCINEISPQQVLLRLMSYTA